jgi:hypothetical protein
LIRLRWVIHTDVKIKADQLKFEQLPDYTKTLSGSMDDLNSEVVISHEEIPLCDDVATLNGHAIMLLTKFEKEGQQSDLDNAIALYEQALEACPAPHPERSTTLSGFATALWTRYKQESQQKSLDDTVSLQGQALELQCSSYSNQSRFFSNLATALWTQFIQKGHQNDLDDSISLCRQALKLCPLGFNPG